MTDLVSFTAVDQADAVTRLSRDGLRALGLAGPVLSPMWAAAPPAAGVVDVAGRTFTIVTTSPNDGWLAPMPGFLEPHEDGVVRGFARADGSPLPNGAPAVVLRIHPQARLRLEREVVRVFQTATGDRSIRPLPASIVVRTVSAAGTMPEVMQHLTAGEIMPPGVVSFHDERGLMIDPFAFAALVAALLTAVPALAGPAPSGTALGTPAAFAALAPAGRFLHVVDLHGRAWVDPGAPNGLSVGPTRVIGGGMFAWAAGDVLVAEADTAGTQPPPAQAVRFGWSTNGVMGTTPLGFPAPPAATPIVRDTVRVAAVDLAFHLLGNRRASDRDGVPGADDRSVAEPAPLVRDGSTVALLADGHAVLGWMGAVFAQLLAASPSGVIQTGPIVSATTAYDDGRWPLPIDPTAAGRWPVAPAATAVAPTRAQFDSLRSITASWIQATNDVVVTLPSPADPAARLPVGVFVRLYPRLVVMGHGPDERPLLVRLGGGAMITTNATDQIVLRDPFRLGTGARPATATLRVDAGLSWLDAATGGVRTRIVANLAPTVGADVAAPASPPPNLLVADYWKSTCSAPIYGGPSRGSFNLSSLLGDPIAVIQGVVRQLSTDQNPREAPRLPTMARTESLWAVQLQAPGDLYRSVLTGGWLTRETDTHTYDAANPAAAGESEVHAPGVAAQGQLGFDLWVASAHRARPIVPTASIASPLAGLANTWIGLQANATSAPPPAPVPPNASTIAGALLQTVPAFVETPELALIPAGDVQAVTDWITNEMGSTVSTPNDPELHRQMVREVFSCKYGRRDAQWALRRAIGHARELIYIETPLFGATADATLGAPGDPEAAVDLIAALATRLTAEPGLRVVVAVPRELPFAPGFEPWGPHFHKVRNEAVALLEGAGGTVDGRKRFVAFHPIGFPGRPLQIRTTTVVVDDVWCLSGTSTFSRRGLTFDGANDVVLVDRTLDRGAGRAIRAHRRALMAQHLGVAPPPNSASTPAADWVRLASSSGAHAAFADVLASGGRGKILPIWRGPDPTSPSAPIGHDAAEADPDGRGGTSVVQVIAAALAGSGSV